MVSSAREQEKVREMTNCSDILSITTETGPFRPSGLLRKLRSPGSRRISSALRQACSSPLMAVLWDYRNISEFSSYKVVRMAYGRGPLRLEGNDRFFVSKSSTTIRYCREDPLALAFREIGSTGSASFFSEASWGLMSLPHWKCGSMCRVHVHSVSGRRRK